MLRHIKVVPYKIFCCPRRQGCPLVFSGDNLRVLARHHERVGSPDTQTRDQLQDVRPQRPTRECLVGRAIVGLENLEPVIGQR